MSNLIARPAPATARELAVEINKMFLGFPSFNRDPENHRLTIAAYVEALEGLPLLAVQMGRKKALLIGSAFPPSAGEFREMCRTAPAVPQTQIFIQRGEVGWAEWCEYYLATKGKTPPTDARDGWWFPSKFPPNYQGDAK